MYGSTINGLVEMSPDGTINNDKSAKTAPASKEGFEYIAKAVTTFQPF